MHDHKKPFVWKVNADGPGTYERFIVPTWMADWAPDLIHAGGVGPGMKVLDAACGTGIVARKAAGIIGPGGRIAALDANEGMLRVARTCAEKEGAHAIGWYHGDISCMPFSLGEFDTVLCQQGLQFFSDRALALREMKRILKPGGRLALSVWGRPGKCPHVPVICDVFEQYFGEDSTAIFTVACSLSDKRVLKKLVQDAGFSGIRIREGVKIARHSSLTEFLPAYFSIFPVAARISALSEDERTGLFRCLESSLEAYRENEGFAVPTENYILTAENR